MDVTCERCSTAYEFDDALVSERGTTVKCTNCGHQFKVRRPAAAGGMERWLVRTIDGRELEFRALRELQAAIGNGVITRDDVLSRGGSRPRRLGNIAELEPFFATAAGAAGPSKSTTMGLGPGGAPAPARGPRAPLPPAAGSNPFQQPRGSSSDASAVFPLPRGLSVDEATVVIPGRGRPSPPPPPPRRSTPPPPPAAYPGVVVAPAGAPPPPVAPTAHDEPSAPPSSEEDTRALIRDASGVASVAGVPSTTKPSAPSVVRPVPSNRARPDDVSAPTKPFEVGKVLDPVQVRTKDDWLAAPPASEAEVTPPPQNQDTASVPPLTPTPGDVRHSYSDEAFAEPRFSAPPRRPGAARWIVGVVVAGTLALGFATVGRKMLGDGAQKGGEGDARITAFLAEGEKSLTDGDLETAKEQFDKASALVERDARTAADLARLAAVKADVDWLRVRLLADGDAEQSVAKRQLAESAQRAKKAADGAAAVAPTDPAVVRSRIDALRQSGDIEGARKLVAGISSAGAQPDNALALATLDLAESKPDWPTVLARLRAALPADANLGRARAMLVYALARSGDAPGAKAELDRLAALPRPYPLLAPLKAYVLRTEKAADVNALPDASGKPLAGAGKPAASTPSVAGAGTATREPPTANTGARTERPSGGSSERPAPPPPEDHPIAPTGPIDTSDLPGVKAPITPPPPPPPANTGSPAPTAPPPPTAPTSTLPPGVDTSDLPGFK